MKVEYGLLLPSREVLLWRDSDLGFLVDAGQNAERAGFDSLWVGDSLLARPRGEPLLLLAALAGVTSRARLGTAVLLPLLRHPVTLAHSLATLDRISQGRLIVGVGPGAELPGTHAELKVLGVQSDRRVGGLLDSVERCRALWRDTETGVQLRPAPQTSGGPAFWLGAHGPRMLRLAGERFDGWLPFSPTPDEYASGLRAVRESAEKAGRDPQAIAAAVYLTLAISDGAKEAERDFDAYIRAYYGVPGQVMARAQASYWGTLDSAAAWVNTYVEAGARHVILRLARPTLDGFNDASRQLLGAVSGLRPAL